MSAVLPLKRHKLSVEDYHRMGRAGVFAPGERVELIEGEVIDMAPINSAHAGVVSLLTTFFVRSLGEAGIVFTQNPIRLLPDSEPQPDISILKPRADYYRKSLPGASDVLLLIEVADTSTAYDRRIKLPLYASCSIPEYWLVDLKAERLEVHSSPKGKSFGSLRRLGKLDIATPALLPAISLHLKEIWPAAQS
jgi:Uma2 family endonuclease